MDLKARIAAFESGTPLPAEAGSPVSSSPSHPSPSSAGVGLDELTRTSLEAARRRARAGSSASTASSNGGSGGGYQPSGLGLGQLGARPGMRRVGSGGSSIGGKGVGAPPQVTLNGGFEGEIPVTRGSPKLANSSIISLYPTPPSPSRTASTSSVVEALSLRPLEPTRSPSPSNSISSIKSSTNQPRTSTSSSSPSTISVDEFATLVRPSSLRGTPSSSSLPITSDPTRPPPPAIARKPAPPPPAPAFNLGLPEPKRPPPPMPTNPKPHRSASARGPTLSLQTATPEGSPDLGESDMIRFSPIGGGPTPRQAPSFDRFGLRRTASTASETTSLRSVGSNGSGPPPPLPSRLQTSSLNPSIPSPSKHKPSLSTSSFQSVELEGPTDEDDEAQTATPTASSPARPPLLPQRKPTLPSAIFSSLNESIPAPAAPSPVSYARRVRRVPPPVPPSAQTPPALSPRPSFNATPTRSAYRTAPPPPPPAAAKPTSAQASARYGALFVKLVALRRVARMKIALSSSTGSGSGGAGWKRASVVEGQEDRLEGAVVRLVWERSRLDRAFLMSVWERADMDGTGSLGREGFVKGMGEIDAELGRRRRGGR